MTEFLQERHMLGITLGLCTFLIIGLFHPICIKCEYYFGTRCWWAFALLGFAMCFLSIALFDPFWSTLSGVVGFSSFWTILEIFEQRKRVMRGWFPMNPRRKEEYITEDSTQE